MRYLTIFCLALWLVGCSSPQVRDYAAEQPRLELSDYFNGELEAWGMFQNRSGEVVKRFHVAMTGTWEGDTGVLDERFTYSDGTTERRVWTLRRQADGSWRGTAGDVVGEAVGEVAGNALNWRYTLRLPVDGRTYEVQFDDWMYLMDGRVMLNRARMSKWGFYLGEVTLSFSKPLALD
ncbi:Protein of unknown function [Pseudomonas cuatrocienegasensis]|uniref:DUF3833 domain-containing protein n=1 Tax=Pseudomonas cuatrocienegasensis TaxID=543360 RepID=A0ABY1B6J4_9PSED|nr:MULTISPECIES: DUF3833 domain-containing protein [Pseudomonas]OEC36861.1 hypothetical protein A7D25_03050 [Pseudomonas sp. 21C1]SEQ08814.1 Protein of unknown function [Pseudomonas cuatrocienegasensis]